MKICIPLRLSSQKDILEAFVQHQSHADIFEVWLDAVEDLDIAQLVAACPKPLLCVCKAKEEKGDFIGSEEERINILIQAAQAGADIIDIGLHTDKKLIEHFKAECPETKLMISFHNWDLTPKMTSMLTRIDQMLELKPDYVKMVSTAKSYEDNIQIFRLAENLKKKQIPFVTMCMGPQGKISRVMTPLLGGEWMYAPVDTNKESAPGQIPAEQLKQLWKELS